MQEELALVMRCIGTFACLFVCCLLGFLGLFLFVCLFVRFICLFVRFVRFVCLFVRFVCLFVRFVCLFVCLLGLFVCLFVYLFVC